MCNSTNAEPKRVHTESITMGTMHAVSLVQFGFYCTRKKTKMKTNSDACFGSLVRFTLSFCSLPYAIWLRCDTMINEMPLHHFGCRIHGNISLVPLCGRLLVKPCTVSLKLPTNYFTAFFFIHQDLRH